MKIGIIGISRIKGTLSKAWAADGHDVIFGMREKPPMDDLPGRIGTVAEAIQHGEAILFAIPGPLLEAAQPLGTWPLSIYPSESDRLDARSSEE
ncbi:MAG: hypothetical protein IT326_02180 [Anaerolineae bacterium]|nr:hypothetical protein [Anaerolineae bacterium]